MKICMYWISLLIISSIAIISYPACAQVSNAASWDGKNAWSYCWSYERYGDNKLVVQPFQEDTETLSKNGSDWEWIPKNKDLVKALHPDGWQVVGAYCNAYRTKNEAEAAAATHAQRLRAKIVNYQPSSNLAGPIKTLTVSFRPAEPYKQEGFAEAQISLSYRVMICVNEVQIAYGLDRKSLKTSDVYFTRQKGVLKGGPAPRAIAPTTIELDGVVSIGNSDYVVARFKDAIAGESLGYDCFSGQTQALGAVGRLVPANVRGNPAATRTWLASLNLHQAFRVLPTVLRSTETAPSGSAQSESKPK